MRITQFGGLVPKLSTKFLPAGKAEIAENLDVYGNHLQPIRTPKDTGEKLLSPCGAVFSGKPKTVHRAGSVLVAWDTTIFTTTDWTRKLGETTFLFVEGGVLYRQSAERILSKQCPIKVGITRPNCPTISLGVDTQAGCEAQEIRPICVPYNTCDNVPHPPVPVSYLFTYMNACGEESAHSRPSDVLDIAWGDAVTVTVDDPHVPDNAVSRRWYRAVTDNEANTHWLLVGETPITQTSFYDLNCPCDFGCELSTETHDAPPDCLEGVIATSTNLTIVWSNKHFWVSEHNFPHAYNLNNEFRLRYAIQGMYEITGQIEKGVHYNALAITDGLHYTIEALEPGEVQIAEIQQRYKCYAGTPVRAESQVLYASPQGLVAITMSGEELLTGHLMTEREWRAFEPRTLRIVYHDDRIIGFTRTGGFIYQIGRDKRRDGEFVTHNIVVDMGYTDETSRCLVFTGPTILEWNAGMLARYDWKSSTSTEAGLWRPVACKVVSPEFDNITPRGYKRAKAAYEDWKRNNPNGKLDVFISEYSEFAQHYSHLAGVRPGIEIIVYADGREYYRRIVRTNKPFLFPRKYKAIDWAVRVIGQVRIDEIHIQTSRESLTGAG